MILFLHVPSEDKYNDIKDGFYEEIEWMFNQLPVYHMKILLNDFNAKVGRENIFQPTIGKENVYPASN